MGLNASLGTDGWTVELDSYGSQLTPSQVAAESTGVAGVNTSNVITAPDGEKIGGPIVKGSSLTGVLTVTGTTTIQYIEIADLVTMGVQVGDQIDIELHFNYTASTNGKTFNLGIGATGAGAAANLTTTTRSTAGEVYLIAPYRIWVVSTSQIMKQSSFFVSYGTNTNQSMSAIAVDTVAGPAKIFVGIQLALGTETASLLGYRVAPIRSI